MNRKCNQHKYNECEFLYLRSTTTAKNVMICSQCVDESNGKIKMIDCVVLKHILEGNSNTILQKYPPLSNDGINQMAFHLSSSIKEEIMQIKDYYKKLIKSYEEAVKKAMNKSKAQIDQLQQLRESFIKQYSEIAQVEKLKQLVVQSQKDQNSDNQLLSFIEIKQKEATENTNKIITQIQELQQYKESFSVEQPKRQRMRVNKEIEDIQFFNKATTTKNSSNGAFLAIQKTQLKSIINQISIKPSRKVGKSQESLQIDRMNNQVQISLIGSWGQCTFESVLDPKKYYILKLQTTIGNRNNPSPLFYFGLIPFSLRHDEEVDTKGISYKECYDSSDFSKMLKGDQLNLGQTYETDMNNFWRKNGERRFEMRVHLENKILKVGSLPDYKLVAELDDKNKIDLSEQYTFAFNCVGLNNIIIVEDISEVDSFDNLM